ncbi:MAG: hypothetical protein M3P30_01870 [Chloroflexota bacterium]|nr:hypothetical protein [Chloroflexota bacterium]
MRKQTMLILGLGAALVVVAGFALASCSGGGKKSPSGGSSADAPTPVSSAIPGTDAVVQLLDAARTSDAIELARLTGYTSVACTTDPSVAASQAPACREGEDNGAKVEVLARLSCGGSWVRPEVVPQEYQTAMRGGPKLVAVDNPKPVAGSFGSDLGVEQVVVMQSGTRLDGSTDGFALYVKDRRVVMLQTPCDSFLQLVSPDAVLLVDVARTSDASKLARLTGYTSIACSKDPSVAVPQAPPCREGEDDGTKVDALARLSCAGSWIRPEVVPGEYQTAMRGGPKLFAAYVPERVAGAFGSDLGVEQVLVMQTGTRLDGSTDGFALHIKNGRVVMLQTPCDSFLQLVNTDLVGAYIADPAK